MGFRDRVRKTFKKKDGSSSSGGSTPSTGSDPSHYTGRTDIEYYKPNEIPKSKYKGRVDPEHKEKLETYSFADAFNQVKRKSSQALSGIMSPGGTKSQSRRPSYMSHMSSNKGAVTPGNLSRQPTSAGNRPQNFIRENSDDDTNVMNTGASRRPTALEGEDTPLADHTPRQNVPEVKLQRQATVSDQPFTMEELEQAMTKATFRAEGNDFARNSMAVATH